MRYFILMNDHIVERCLVAPVTKFSEDLLLAEIEADNYSYMVIESDAGCPASPGYTWDPESSTFMYPSPYPSWLWKPKENYSGIWEAPIPQPEDGLDYQWDEESRSWLSLSLLKPNTSQIVLNPISGQWVIVDEPQPSINHYWDFTQSEWVEDI